MQDYDVIVWNARQVKVIRQFQLPLYFKWGWDIFDTEYPDVYLAFKEPDENNEEDGEYSRYLH
jgi:hypothetical protein